MSNIKADFSEFLRNPNNVMKCVGEDEARVFQDNMQEQFPDCTLEYPFDQIIDRVFGWDAEQYDGVICFGFYNSENGFSLEYDSEQYFAESGYTILELSQFSNVADIQDLQESDQNIMELFF